MVFLTFFSSFLFAFFPSFFFLLFWNLIGYPNQSKWKSDIDECSKNHGGCDVNAICTNTPGSYSCACKPQFSGTGIVCNGNYFNFCYCVMISLYSKYESLIFFSNKKKKILMNVWQIMEDVMKMQIVKIHLVDLIVHVKKDLKEMDLIVLVIFFFFNVEKFLIVQWNWKMDNKKKWIRYKWMFIKFW